MHAMSLKEMLLGSDHPTTGQKIGTAMVLGGLALFLYGYWTDFVPTEEWTLWGLGLSAALTVILGGLVYAGQRRGLYEMETVQAILAPIVGCGVLWVGIVHGLSDGVTLAIGKPATIETADHKVRIYGGRGCRFQLEGDFLDRAYPGHLCIAESSFDRIPKGSRIRLHGTESALGFRIEQFSIVPPAKPVAPDPAAAR